MARRHEGRGSPHGPPAKLGRVSTDKRFEKVQQNKLWKMYKFTKPFCRLSIPTARGCASILHLPKNSRELQGTDASVYIAFACKADMDSGSDYGATCEENFEQKTLGVFFFDERGHSLC